MNRRALFFSASAAATIAMFRTTWAQGFDLNGWVTGQKARIRKDVFSLIKSYERDGARGVKKELALQFIRNTGNFATSVIENLDRVTSIQGLADVYGVLGSIEKSLLNIVSSRSTPPEVKALANIALGQVQDGRRKVRALYVALGGDLKNLPAIVKNFDPIPVIIVPKDTR